MIDHLYVLAKNEEANLRRCLDAALKLGVPVTVLDSGSTDGSRDIYTLYDVSVEDYPYVDHCTSYNDLTARHGTDQALIVLDADMIVSRDFASEAASVLESIPKVHVITSPIDMWWDGVPLPWGSLYPPKALAFRGGDRYFEPAGHGERLRPAVRIHNASSPTIHDDQRDYRDELLKQIRYAEALVKRSQLGSLSARDRLRVRSPLLILLAPFATYILRRGFLSGKAGILYALDRLIAEAIAYRMVVHHRLYPEGPIEAQTQSPLASEPIAREPRL